VPRNPRSVLPSPVFDEPVFSEGKPTRDPTGFTVQHPSDAQLYSKIQALLYEDVVGFPLSRAAPSALYELATALGPRGPELVDAIQSAGHIAFHMAGDIGASTAAKYPGEIRVSDQITNDCHTSVPADRPAFLFLLGDVVYDFGESQYYYDQFYEPYRDYPAPIFSIPGNHDSFIVPGTSPVQEPLTTFQRNFCNIETVVTPEAGSLHRTAMTQPGVYFTLDAPFVRIIGLFSNALEDPGVISSEAGTWKSIPDYQLAFLSAQLARVKSDPFSGALLLAVHHPPFTYAPPPGGTGAGGPHAGNSAMLAQIDSLCKSAGVYPHAVLAGHAHNYQRYTRSIQFAGSPYQVPFLVCGDGGHDVAPLVQARNGSPAQEPTDGANVSYLDPTPSVVATGLVLERHNDQSYGYLRVSVNSEQLTIGFYQVGTGTPTTAPADTVTVDLESHTLVGGSSPSPSKKGPTRTPGTARRGRRPR
jgi:hypothetical protein